MTETLGASTSHSLIAPLAPLGLFVMLAGALFAQWVTGGRSRFGGWFLTDRERRKRRARLERQYPKFGRWFLTMAYSLFVIGAALFVGGLVL